MTIIRWKGTKTCFSINSENKANQTNCNIGEPLEKNLFKSCNNGNGKGEDGLIPAGKFTELLEPAFSKCVGERTLTMYTDHMTLKYKFHINFTAEIRNCG